MFRKILVANRGEIARRLFRACRELGVRSVAVYSEVDRGAPWARQADESYPLKGNAAAETYLNGEAIVSIAKAVNADAIHPGYGFLSENVEFVRLCERRHIAFIGPAPEAMLALGSKARARELARANDVPVIPGVDGRGKSDAELLAAAEQLGFPVLIKASGGGGGKGMRVVSQPGEFATALASARHEALAAFNDDHMLLERYFERARHVEVQVFGDLHGNLVHLFERECSIQRRHQKIVEESPAPGLSPALRAEMTAAALRLARAVEYTSAGTVEFLLDPDGRFYLLEMNTRLQVEHPVTEAVTGLDLAAWQIRAAAGEALSFDQAAVSQRGHALECRIYAEDPANGFLPSIGRLDFYRAPAGPGIRCDDGVEAGRVISPHYDPMLAKLITWGWDRPEAIRKMQRALRDYVVLGPKTNIPFLLDLLDTAAFQSGELETGFIERHLAGWQPAAELSETVWLAMAAFEALSPPPSRREASEANGFDPWAGLPGSWRNLA
jgi:3-methylcrotonyl-CoA carboxylase alpha subunit